MSFGTCILIMAGGAMGTLARYLVSVLALPVSRELPWGTIIINVTGSFIIGLFGTFTLANGRLSEMSSKVIHDVVRSERHQAAALDELLIARHAERQVELEASSFREFIGSP